MEPLEPVGINPRIDCVFRRIFEEQDLLLDFLNAVLEPTAPMSSVELLSPMMTPRQLDGRAATLDVKATDAQGRVFQIEMQTWNQAALRNRMLHTWAELYTRQLSKGQDYRDIQPAISIWLLNQNLFRSTQAFRHRFCVHDPQQDTTLSDHLQIYALELDRWRKKQTTGTATQKHIEGWLAFFSGAETWSKIPQDIASPQLEKAMSILERFRDNLDWYAIYSSQIAYERQKLTEQRVFAEAQEALTETRSQLSATEQQLSATEQQLSATEQQLSAAEQQLVQVEQQRIEAEQQRVEVEQQRVEVEQQRAEAEAREELLRRKLAALGIDPDV